MSLVLQKRGAVIHDNATIDLKAHQLFDIAPGINEVITDRAHTSKRSGAFFQVKQDHRIFSRRRQDKFMTICQFIGCIKDKLTIQNESRIHLF